MAKDSWWWQTLERHCDKRKDTIKRDRRTSLRQRSFITQRQTDTPFSTSKSRQAGKRKAKTTQGKSTRRKSIDLQK